MLRHRVSKCESWGGPWRSRSPGQEENNQPQAFLSCPSHQVTAAGALIHSITMSRNLGHPGLLMRCWPWRVVPGRAGLSPGLQTPSFQLCPWTTTDFLDLYFFVIGLSHSVQWLLWIEHKSGVSFLRSSWIGLERHFSYEFWVFIFLDDIHGLFLVFI
jgi:hypothetical protein